MQPFLAQHVRELPHRGRRLANRAEFQSFQRLGLLARPPASPTTSEQLSQISTPPIGGTLETWGNMRDRTLGIRGSREIGCDSGTRTTMRSDSDSSDSGVKKGEEDGFGVAGPAFSVGMPRVVPSFCPTCWRRNRFGENGFCGWGVRCDVCGVCGGSGAGPTQPRVTGAKLSRYARPAQMTAFLHSHQKKFGRYPPHCTIAHYHPPPPPRHLPSQSPVEPSSASLGPQPPAPGIVFFR